MFNAQTVSKYLRYEISLIYNGAIYFYFHNNNSEYRNCISSVDGIKVYPNSWTCAIPIDLKERIIASPNYPSSCSHNLKCTWTLTNLLSDSSKIKIHFYSFATKDAEDKLTIKDLSNNNVSQFWGSTLPSDFISTGKKIEIKFASDAKDNAKGFSLKYYIKGIFKRNILEHRKYLD